MYDAATATARPEAVNPPAVSLHELWPWCLFGAALLLVLMYLIGVEGGALSLGPGHWIHEFTHDGRHLLTFPCH